MANSVWTLPLVVVGALMVAIAWIGRRLDGRFAVEWGEGGTQLEFRAKIKSPAPARHADPGASPRDHELTGGPDPGPGQPEIIEGEAHTVEIEVSELEALIAAVETSNGHRRDSEASGPGAPSFQVVRGEAAARQNPATPRTTR